MQLSRHTIKSVQHHILAGLIMGLVAISIAVPVYAGESTNGYAVDMLPLLLNSESGKSGGIFQAWRSKDHYRTGLTLAVIHYPDSTLDEPEFTNRDTNSVAVTRDYFFSDGIKGWWIGGGIEYWDSSIIHKQTNIKSSYSSMAINAGVGYKLNIADNFYVEPWTGLHYVLGRNSVTVGQDSYNPSRATFELSIKIGWQADL